MPNPIETLASLGCEISHQKGELVISKQGQVLVEDRPPRTEADIAIIIQEVKRTLRSFNL